ncbi:MAG: histidine kinase dimerization/phospho-acceptor domain-containing protein [Ignavibacteriaceae bacterium]
MFSIKFKIILAYTILFGIILFIFAVIIYQSTKQNDISNLDANLNSYSNILQTEIEEELNEDNKLDINELKSIPIEGMHKVSFKIFHKHQGKIYSDSILLKDNSFDNEINSIKNNVYKTIKLNGKNFRSLLSSIEADNDSQLVLQTSASLEYVESDLNRLLIIFWIVIPLSLLTTGLTAFFISKKAFKPVTQMAETADKISIDNLDKRLKLPEARDEIFLLGQTLNRMIERIDNSVKAQKQFIADASHEIKTPLTIIQTELELAEKAAGNLSLKENTRIALSEIERLNSLVKSLLTIVKLESLQNTLC